MRLNVNAISSLDVVDFNFIRMQNRTNHNCVVCGRPDGNGAIGIVHRNSSPGSHGEAEFLAALGQDRPCHYRKDCNDLNAAAAHVTLRTTSPHLRSTTSES